MIQVQVALFSVIYSETLTSCTNFYFLQYR